MLFFSKILLFSKTFIYDEELNKVTVYSSDESYSDVTSIDVENKEEFHSILMENISSFEHIVGATVWK